jgi:broad specificity phosphatase PhoE
MSRLILVRHGESSGNRQRIFATTPHSLPLTELGYDQARGAARRIAESFRPEIVVTSPFLRASETARIIADALGVPLAVEPNLYEREVGAHRGRSYDSYLDSPDYDPQRPWAWKPEGGESYEEVQARVAPILDRLTHSHPDADLVVVSHGGVMVTLWAYVTGDWESAYTPPNCGMVVIEHSAQGYSKPRVIDDTGGAQHAGG